MKRYQRVSIEDIELAVHSERYFTADDGRQGAMARGTYIGHEQPDGDARRDLEPLRTLMFCVLVLDDGYTVVGRAFCRSLQTHDLYSARCHARQAALNEIWVMKGAKLSQQWVRTP